MTDTTPLDTETTLRAAVKADPADRTAKLVLADFLDGLDTRRKPCPGCSEWRDGAVLLEGYDVSGTHYPKCPRCSGTGSVLDHSAPIEAALLRVLAHPERDDLRLAYADAVEPADKERAEFVRVQVELHKYQRERNWLENMPVEQWAGDPSTGKLLRRLSPLVKRHTELCHEHVRDCKGWSREFIQGVLGKNWLQRSAAWQWGWERGLISTVELPAADWLEHGAKICERHPVEKVRLTTMPKLEIEPNPEKPQTDSRVRIRGQSRESDWVSATEIVRDIQFDHKNPPKNWLVWLLRRRYPGVEFELPA